MLNIYFHQFEPHDVTGIIALVESYISIHTWPEYNYAALHIFVCGDFEKAFTSLDYLREKLRPMFVKKEIHLRELTPVINPNFTWIYFVQNLYTSIITIQCIFQFLN